MLCYCHQRPGLECICPQRENQWHLESGFLQSWTIFMVKLSCLSSCLALRLENEALGQVCLWSNLPDTFQVSKVKKTASILVSLLRGHQQSQRRNHSACWWGAAYSKIRIPPSKSELDTAETGLGQAMGVTNDTTGIVWGQDKICEWCFTHSREKA